MEDMYLDEYEEYEEYESDGLCDYTGYCLTSCKYYGTGCETA